MNDTLVFWCFPFGNRENPFKQSQKQCEIAIVITSHVVPGPRPGLWSTASCLDLANASPTHRPFLGSSETPKWWTQQTPRKHRLLRLMCRRLSTWQVYLHACLWGKNTETKSANRKTKLHPAFFLLSCLNLRHHLLNCHTTKTIQNHPDPTYCSISPPCNPLALHQQLWKYPVVLQNSEMLWHWALKILTYTPVYRPNEASQCCRTVCMGRNIGRSFGILPYHIPWLQVCCLEWFGELVALKRMQHQLLHTGKHGAQTIVTE